MIRNILIGSLLAFGPLLATTPAQHVAIGFGRGGVSLHLDTSHRPRVVRPPQTGHWVIRRERVWVEGRERVVHVPARYAWRRDACGRMVRVCVRPAYDRVVREPGRWGWRERRVWVSGHGGRGRRY